LVFIFFQFSEKSLTLHSDGSGSKIFGFGFGYFPPKMSNFSIFDGSKNLGGAGQKVPGSMCVGLLFTVGQGPSLTLHEYCVIFKFYHILRKDFPGNLFK